MACRIYLTPNNKVKLTGVGVFQDHEYFVLDKENAQWYTEKDSDFFTVYGMREMKGLYLFHDRCWGRVMEHFSPDEFDLVSLHKALLPFPRSTALEPPSYCLASRYEDKEEALYALPSIDQLMLSPKAVPNTLDSVRKLATKTDVFSVLPVEISNDSKNPDKMSHETDWRLLYHCTCKIKCGLEFDFQIGIWESMRWLRDATLAFKSGTTEMPLHYRGKALQDYHNYYATLWMGNTHTESVDIGPSLSEIAISGVKIGDYAYISGIKFIFDDDRPDVLIGYAAPGATIMHGLVDERQQGLKWKFLGIQIRVKVSNLLGFSFYTDDDYIRSIMILHLTEVQLALLMGLTLGGHPSIFLVDEVTKVIAVFEASSILISNTIDRVMRLTLGIGP
ncbi:hypothetical protein BGW36DRAFT_447746 [Talaromyces proteolyticus]|uniref:Uncharacterized protein n=1 Tax=Talaromyces proteolyticus TaxID=1131652 RepID=A0AAD4KVS8_9EURO|nr:uncharacterized protein BGW36DRAFT_447746 [Talaromyces proteolyticus]KAH8700900.1 hypothetical protein BGW36DRAFT_447746 [Talaromyces proteolyticus]